MRDMEVYDKAKYHYEGEYPKAVPPTQAFVLTESFLGWIADKELFSEEIAKEFASNIAEFKGRKLAPSGLYARLGGVSDETMLLQEGNQFTKYYFDFEVGRYLGDFEELLVRDLPSFYHVADNWSNYGIISARVDERYVK